MPDDSSADYKLKQSEHARRIKAERDFMSMSGMTRSQVRSLEKGLTEFNQRLDKRKEPEVLGPPMPPKIETTETKSEAPVSGTIGKERNSGGTTPRGSSALFEILQVDPTTSAVTLVTTSLIVG